MPDYNKLTVIKLREELVSRGLPKSGLKPVLVSRLIESDAQTQQVNSTTDAQPVEQPAPQAEQVALNAPPPLVRTQDPGGTRGGANGVDTGGIHPSEPETGSAIDAVLAETNPAPILESLAAVQNKDVIPSAPEETSPDEPPIPAPDTEPPLETLENNSSFNGAFNKELSSDGKYLVQDMLGKQSPNEPATEPSLNGALDKELSSGGADLVEEILEKKSTNEAMAEPSPPTNKSPLPDPTQLSLSGNEMLEDSRKRKRRSHSPPLSAIESAQKRAKTEGSRLDVKLPEDMDADELQGVEAEVAHDASMIDLAPVQLQETAQTATHTLIRVESLPAAADFGVSTDQVDISESAPPDHHMSEALKGSQYDTENPLAQTRSEHLPLDIENTAALPPKERSPLASEDTPARPSIEGPKSDNEKTPALASSEELENDNKDTPALPLSEELPPDTEKSPTPPSSKAPPPDIEKTPVQLPNGDSPGKHSPSDTRFKNLFAGPSKREASPIRTQPSYADQEDRVVSSAIHPATSALYIRDFMRPLHPDNLKDFLVVLATPSGATPNAQIITEFFLDPIRTHCLVGFDNTSAASRVRSSLHNRVWPNERSRRPLWVDFVPEEKLKKWIRVEHETSSSRQAGKRWEVVYEEEDDGTKAYLQEAGVNPMTPRPPQPHGRSEEVGQGVRGAPSGPRSREVEPRPSQSDGTLKADNGKGFQALDDLFPSTDAKPKLYYLPVDKSTVNKRLDALDAGRGGGRGDEMRRYTFEEDTIVDRGPEFGARGRGGHGGRGGGGGGGYGGGFYGRGGGYRGDNWRDRR